MKATLASPDQGANNIPVSSIGLKDNVLTFESKIIGAKFTGKKNTDRDRVRRRVQPGRPQVTADAQKDGQDHARRAALKRRSLRSLTARKTSSMRIKAGGVKLAGTLTVPPGPGPFPAVILITGSGPQDRDESLLGHKPFLVLADYLTRRGVAVLRVDDRGVGGSTGADRERRRATTSRATCWRASNSSNGRKEIDSKKIGLIGHSEGGIIAPIAAARSKDVAFIVLMAGTGVPGSQILEAQGQLILKASGSLGIRDEHASAIPEAADRHHRSTRKTRRPPRSKLAAALKEILAAMPEVGTESRSASSRRTLRGRVDAGQQRLVSLLPHLRSAHRPCGRSGARCWRSTAKKTCKFPAKENLAEIDKALKAGGNRNVKTVELPGLNHLFQPCKTGAPSEYGIDRDDDRAGSLENRWEIGSSNRHRDRGRPRPAAPSDHSKQGSCVYRRRPLAPESAAAM